MERISTTLRGLADSITALANAISPPAEPDIIEELHEARQRVALKRQPRVNGFYEWPAWGTEHVMSCTRVGCFTCARLAATPGEVSRNY